MSDAVKKGLGAVLIIGGAVVGVTTGNWALAITLASTGAGLLTAPGDVVTPDQGTTLTNQAGPNEYLPVVYGTSKLGGLFSDIRVYVDTSVGSSSDPASQRKLLVVVMAWCHGSRDGSGITSIDEVWFEDRRALVGSVMQSPFNGVVPDKSPTKHWLEYAHALGSSSQSVDARLTALFPLEWPTTSKGQGIAYTRFEFFYSTDVYPSGLPTILAKIRGSRVYDPRDSTWKWSANPALCIRDYLCSAIYGFGVLAANLDDTSFINMANYCDELVTLPDGSTQVRFELNGVVDTSRSTVDNLAALCSSCRGQVVNEGDLWRLVIRRQRTVSGFKINSDNTVEGTWTYILPGSTGTPNIARVQYIDPGAEYIANTVQWPEPGQTNAYLTDDNGYEQRLEMSLPFTDNRLRAQQIGMLQVKESRQSIGVTVTLKESALVCRVGDLVQVTYETPGWVDKTFDIAALLLQPDGGVQAIMVEYDPTVYDLSTQFPQPAIPDTDLPNPYVVTAPTSLVLTSLGQELTGGDGGYIPRIRATWAKSNDPFVQYYDVQARKSLTPDLIVIPAPFASSAFSQTGLSSYTASKVWDDVTSVTAWSTDSATSGAQLQLDVGVGQEKEYIACQVYAASAGYTGNYTVEYSDNGSSWSAAKTGFIPALSGANIVQWATVGPHRYWRIRLTNTPGGGPELNELRFFEGLWDSFGRVPALSDAFLFIYPVTPESWDVRIRAVNTLGVTSDWVEATHAVDVPDPRPQILSITLTNAHSDVSHTDTHTDISHGDAGHADGHSDTSHTDHNDHGDSHADSGTHGDVSHADSHGDVGAVDTDHTDTHSDNAHSDHSDGHSDAHTDTDHTDTAHDDGHGDVGAVDTDHTDIHSDNAHNDHSDTGLEHTDVVHVDSHSDAGHADSSHSDGHTDSAHGDGQYGVGVAIQADSDSASMRAVARKHGDHSDSGHTDVTEPTVVEVRTQDPHNGRNVVIELLDIATGTQVLLNPGDTVRVGALAYSDTGGGGVEGPLALASVSLFQASVAPVGTDMWWPA